mmetsp:Transcript_101855/g.202235  ORF Transcript_101855/g.202235 Transcript_101855/m.202235 type:complete len:513 (+) Transcript_101855:55-1593(+)
MLAMTAPPSPRSVARHAKKSLTLDNIEWDSWDSAVFAGGQEVTLGQSKTEACFKTVWPSKDDVGALSLTPRLLTPRKPHKLKALDVDLGKMIEATAHFTISDAYLDGEGDGFTPEKDEKKAKAKEELQAQVRTLQTRIDKVQIDMDRNNKTKAGTIAKIEKLQAEHSILQARRTWAESSLESATAAQDEWRKHHETVRKSLKAAEEQLAKKEAELATTLSDGQQADTLRRTAELERLRHLQHNRDKLELASCEHNCRAEAVINRMVCGWMSDLVLLSFRTWSGLVQQQKLAAETEEGEKATRITIMSAKLRHKQRADCARMICHTNSDVVSLVLKAWQQAATNFDRCGAATETSEPTLRIAEHVRRQQSRELLTQVMIGWSMSASSNRAVRSREAKAQADFAKFDRILQVLGEQMTLVDGDLSEACAELTASQSKCLEIKQAIVESMEVQAQLVNGWDAFEEAVENEWYGTQDDDFQIALCKLQDEESDSGLCPPKTMDDFEAEWWPAVIAA